MNIFVFSEDPEYCARCLDDKRVGKLMMEQNQMMSLAIKTLSGYFDELSHMGEGMITRGWAHLNNPLSIWVRQTYGNFEWTYRYAKALDAEFQHRFGFRHGTAERTDFIWTFRDCLPKGELLPFHSCARNEGFDLDFTHLPVFEGYREYIQARWLTDTRPVVFTERMPPEWSSL